MKTLTFLDFKCVVDTNNTYSNGAVAIQLFEEDSGEPVAVATINVMQGLIEKDEVVIKNYSENEGILDVMVEAEVISKPLRYIQISDFVKAPVCKLL